MEHLLPLFDAETGQLRSEEFSEAAWSVLEQAGARAGGSGYDRILPPHCFLPSSVRPRGSPSTWCVCRLQPEVGPGKVGDMIRESFRLADSRGEPATLGREGIGEAAATMLRSAQRLARGLGAERVDSPHLLAALLEVVPGRLESVLRRAPLSLDLVKMRGHLDQTAGGIPTKAVRETAFRLPLDYCPRKT